ALDGHPEHRQLALQAVSLGGSPPFPAESLDVYTDGVACYAAILAAVAAARGHVHLEYYIWEADTIGTPLRAALIERARARAPAPASRCACWSTPPAARACARSSCARCATPAWRSRCSTRCGCARCAGAAPTSAATARSSWSTAASASPAA